MTHGSLFSGIGGFDLAAEWMGWDNVFHCEINPFGQKVLKHYWPNAISYTDITKTDFSIHRGGINIVTGGFPCQPFSSAGKRKGTEDSRHLWPEMLRAIREIQPRYVVGENVRGITNWNGGMVFDQVQADLEAEGFEVLPFLLPACAVNAPHRRDRIWFVAHSKDANAKGGRESNDSQREGGEEIGSGLRDESGSDGTGWVVANSGLQRPQEYEKQAMGIEQCSEIANASSDNQGLERSASERIQTNERRRSNNYNGELTGTGEQISWQGFPTQSPVCGGDDGLPAGLSGITVSKHRKESIMAYGNSIVPQVAYQIFKAIASI